MNGPKYLLLCLTALAFGYSSSAYCQSQGIVADLVVTQSRQLSNGTQSENSSVGEYALDNEGRMRVKINGRVLISDPIVGKYWRVDIAKGVALQSRAPASNESGADQERATSGESWKSTFALPQGNWPTPPQPTIQDLADQTINGVACKGQRSRFSLAAGAFGNVAPLVIETDVWTSNAFGLVLPVMVTVRSGRNNFNRRELRNVRASNFTATHFQPDTRYTIVSQD